MTSRKKAAAKSAAKKTSAPSGMLAKLYFWNRLFAVLYALQGAAILLLSATKLYPITTSYLTRNSLATEITGNPVYTTATRHVFDINLAYLLAALLFVAALAHAICATMYRKRYEAGLQQSTNYVRWSAYAIGGGLALAVVSILSGITDMSTLRLVILFGAFAGLLGLAMELRSQGKVKSSWLTYVLACIAGAVPWTVIATYIWGALVYGGASIPAYLYGVCATLFLLFAGVAVIMYLQHKKTGTWQQYPHAERVYIVLSFAAVTAMVWQVFAGVLSP